MITKEDLKQEIEQIDPGFLELAYKLLQQLPHRQPPKPDRVGCSRPICYPDSENAEGVAFADIKDAAVFGKQ
jgi:hypothetical protein